MNLLEIYGELIPVKIEDFAKSFYEAKTNAFRLEMLDMYTVPGEIEQFKNYLANEKAPSDFNKDWIQLIKKLSSKGVNFQRVRFAKKPFSEYLKFEVSWGYAVSSKAGETISVITSEGLPQFSQSVPIIKDFWLFDQTKCFLMEYDIVGQFLGVNQVPNEYVETYNALRKELLDSSIKLKDSEIWDFA